MLDFCPSFYSLMLVIHVYYAFKVELLFSFMLGRSVQLGNSFVGTHQKESLCSIEL